MFTSGTDVRHDGSKVTSAIHRTEAPGDFLFHFKHTNITFRLVIVKRNAKIGKKQQIFVFMKDEPVNKRAGFSPFGFAFFVGSGAGTGFCFKASDRILL